MTTQHTVWKQFNLSVQKTARLTLGLSFVTNLCLLVLPLYTLQIFDRVLTSSSQDTLWMLAAGMAIVAVTAIIFESMRRDVLMSLARYMDNTLFPSMNTALNLSADEKNKSHVTGSYNFFRKNLKTGSLLTLVDACWLPLFLAIVFLIHPLMGAFILSANLVQLIMLAVKTRYYLPKEQEEVKQRKKLQTAMSLAPAQLNWLHKTNSHENWQAAQQESWLQSSATKNEQSVGEGMLLYASHSLKWVAQVGMPTLGAVLLLNNQITAGGFIAALIIGSKAFLPIEQLINQLSGLSRCRAFLKSCEKLFAQEEKNQGLYAEEMKGVIQLQDFSVNTIEKLNVTVEPGQSLALIGPAGAGQDAIFQALSSDLKEHQGDVLIDKVRIADWQPAALCRGLAYVSSSLQLPETSIENLLTGYGQILQSQAIDTAERTGLNQKMIELRIQYSDSWRTGMAAQASGASLKQLIMLTAALARDPAVYLLENPEAGLDMDSLQGLKQLMQEERDRGKTLIYSTQSRSVMHLADEMILFNKGAVVYQGKVTDFIKKGNQQQAPAVPTAGFIHTQRAG